VITRKEWADKIGNGRQFYTLKENEYFDILADISSDFTMWKTIYMHRMPSHQSIIEWYKSTGMKEYLAVLSDEDKIAFEKAVFNEVEKYYPVQKNSEIIFRFPRLFFTAVK
ncbi:MAG: trans-aconitate methyltransferase, partial [Eubacterium sp.]|nr:trans-aconitate methyltransferase [Eubacterium sp.]